MPLLSLYCGAMKLSNIEPQHVETRIIDFNAEIRVLASQFKEIATCPHARAVCFRKAAHNIHVCLEGCHCLRDPVHMMHVS